MSIRGRLGFPHRPPAWLAPASRDELIVVDTLGTDLIARLARDVAELDVKPRDGRWLSLSSSIVNAVWSIRADYDTVTGPITRRVFAATVPGVNALGSPNDFSSADPVPLDRFLEQFPEPETLQRASNRQRTSTRSGISKADAVLRHAKVFVANGITTRQQALALVKDDGELLASINVELARIPGEGQNGVRRSYLWMLCGDDAGVKPDAMVLRWLHRHGCPTDAETARQVLRDVATVLSASSATLVTPWMVDHAVWQAGRLLPA